ncbi:molybdate transport system substrate-binding protein [Natronocella acetinitrilica]|uniref:Molybdate transport system substrate-binding protein n=1 Tax=Natronocella acetinitrilica TaxID=414046 RepID=A0AAE3G6L8_9GAMM|nr:molybdate transport system substrate-binding protein [Natronocella acetinitrilica]
MLKALLRTAILSTTLALPLSMHAQQDRPVIAAASDLQFALSEIAEQFEAETGRSVRLNFGSSGNFRRQIAQGAPYELYLSADETYVHALHEEGHLEDGGILYAIGRIVIVAPRGEDRIVDGSLVRLRSALDDRTLRRFAIANPDHAPYGVAARQALQAAGQWELIEPRLVYGENVSQAARYALSGDTDGGIIAYSLVRGGPLAERATYALIPESAHDPLRQRMALVADAGETARAFYDYLQQEAARAVLADFGFELPDTP